MKSTPIVRVIVATLMISTLAGCAYKYRGAGDYVELTRTYIPGIAETKGFILELPIFETTQDLLQKYKIGKLPKQDDLIYIDLVTSVYRALPTLEEQNNDLQKIPKAHHIRFKLLDAKTGKIISSGESSVSGLKATANRKLMRPFILNLGQIEANSIPEGTALELEVQYTINGTPIPREMFIIITKEARTL